MNEHAAIRAIVEIINEQQKLERHQRKVNAWLETIQDSIVYAYSDILKVLAPYLENG